MVDIDAIVEKHKDIEFTGYESDLFKILISDGFDGSPMDTFVDVVNQPDMRLNEFVELFDKTLKNIGFIFDSLR